MVIIIPFLKLIFRKKVLIKVSTSHLGTIIIVVGLNVS